VCEFPASRPQRGWGQFVEEHFQPGAVKVINLAKNGRSSKSFITEGLWDQAKAQRPEFVLIQFGHNDSHARTEPKATDANGDFKEYLRRYADEARALGAKPIFITPMHHRTFHSDGSLSDILKPYAEAMKAVAAEKSAAVIDLHTMSGELFARLGEKGSEQYANAPGDRTHFNEAGARTMAGLVMRQLPGAEPRLAKVLRTGQR
jgi:lysophospholipase L1-like esterase